MKLPAFQFYPGDWRKDAGVQSLDYESRGIWFEILCLLHESERRGVLLLGGKSMPDIALAKLLGITDAKLKKALAKLEEHGVSSRDTETGAIISRRMMRDEAFRKTRAACGKLGGNPVLASPDLGAELKVELKVTPKVEPTPSVSSSVSSSPPEAPAETDTECAGAPNLKEFTRLCHLLNIPDWYAKERFVLWDAKKWAHKGTPYAWKKVPPLVSRDYENEGRPKRTEVTAPTKMEDPAGWREWLTAKGHEYAPHISAMAHWREAFAKR